jgi:hypothetical protein
MFSSQSTANQKMEAFVSAGQSNESGRGSLTGKETGIPQIRVFGNDYVWRQLEEPSDDATNQIDTVSADTGTAAHSSLLKFAKDLYGAINKPIAVIPNAKGGTSMNQWAPPGLRQDRTTLFGSMDYRVSTALQSNIVLKALLWMQGEADATTVPDQNGYITKHTNMINQFRSYYGNIPVFYNQLAVYANNASGNDGHHIIAEKQRLMETGSGNAASIAQHYMIVTHDLPMNSDGIHISKEGQIEIGRRRALAVRQYLYGHAVNGTGPRLVGISKPTSTTVKVKTTKTINDHNTYENYFTVYDNGSPVTIQSIGRDPGDNTAVLITLASAPVGTVTVDFKPPTSRAQDVRLYNCVQDSDGLPLPQFGPLGLF